MIKLNTQLKMTNWIRTLLLSFGCLFLTFTAHSQVATYYLFSQSNGTYTPITGGTAIATATNHTTSADVSLDQGNYAGTIPFNFNFNGTNYTSFNANGNGYITFGATLPTTSLSTPISSALLYNGVVAAMARDIWGVYGSVGTRTSGSPTITGVTDFTGLVIGKPIRGTGIATGATVIAFNTGTGTITMSANATSASTATYIGWPNGEIRVETIGSAPNRICVIQYSGMSDWVTTAPTGHSMQWQIQLAEGGGISSNQSIKIVYGPQTNLNTTARTQQVGLRGASNTDYNNRTSTTDWSATTAGGANSSTVTRSNAIFPPSGLTFTWIPPNVCSGIPTAGTASAGSNSVCSGSSVNLSLSGYSTGSTGITFQWQQSTTPGGPYSNVIGGTGSTTPNYSSNALTTDMYYICEVTCSASSQTSISNEVAISVLNPQIISTTPNQLCGIGSVNLGASVSSGATANWYAAASGGTPLFTGTSFITPVISTSTNYYVAASSGGSTFNTSKLAPEPAGTGTVLTTYGQDFTVTTGFTLNSVQVFSTTGTSITVALYSSGGTTQLMSTGPVAVTAGTSPTINLGWTIAPGTYRLCVPGMTGNFIRDNSGVTYPFALTGIGTMNGFVSTITGTVTTSSSYYFVYNWSVSTGCESPRQMVTATVTSAPSITASTTQSLVCSGGSTTLNASSSNDPNYSYSWTSTPAGFNASGASVNANPATSTTYTVTAIDNSAGTYSGCTTLSTIDITAQPASVSVTGSPESICSSSGSVDLGLIPATGYPAGSIQWQSSPTGSGYTDIGGATGNTYSTGTISSSTFYRALIKDGDGTVCISPFKEIVVGVPTVNSTTDNTRCGTGTTTLQATGSAGSTIKWYTSSVGGASIASGSPFTTPVINSTTTFYAAAETGAGAPTPGVVGAGAGTSAVYSNPFYSLWSNTHNQHLILASELYAAGISPGEITAGGIDITAAGTLPMLDFSLKLANTSAANLSSFASASFTTVYTSASLMPVVGVNSVTFSTPFVWDGVSNLLIEICHGNPSSTATMNRTCKTDATSFVSSIHTHKTTSPGTAGSVQCTDNTTNLLTYSVRPQFYFTYIPACSSTRTAVTATVTPAPAIAIATTTPAVCPGGSADISVSSANDPDYTYVWTSSPAGFTATGAGPHTVLPSVTTKYYVTATDNSGGANNNCVAIDSVTIINGGTLTAGTVSSAQAELCISGSTTLSLAGASGGANQWQSSVSASGPWTNVGTGSSTYNTGTITETMYYQVVTSCNSSSVTSNVQTVTVNNPSITGTTPATRCGTGTSTLQAIGSAGTTVKWYTTNSGGAPVGTGNSFITPVISTSTPYYAAAELGPGAPAVNAVGAGATTSTVYPCPFYSLWSNTHNQYLILASELFASGITPGAMTALGVDISSAGTLPVIDLSLKMGHTSATSVSAFLSPTFTTVYTSASLMPTTGTNTMTFSTPFVWDGVNNIVIEVCHGNSGSSATMNRTGVVDNTSFISTIHTHKSSASAAAATCSDVSTNLTTYSIRPKFTFTYESVCASPRTAVLATVNPAPAIALVADDLGLCTGGSTNISVTSSNDPNYTYTWTSVPAGFNQTGNGPFTISPTVTTKYFVNAIDNSAGPNNSCVISDSVNVIVTGTLVAGTVSSSQSTYCLNGTPTLTLTGAQGAIQWQSSTVSATGPWTNVGAGLTTYSPSINQTTYFQAEVSCQSSSVQSNVITITIDNPQITGTTPSSRCGAGTLTIGATSSSGTTVNWYDTSIGGSSIATGNTLTTPLISNTTTFYAAAETPYGSATNAIVGAGATTSSTYSNPFYSLWSNTHNQHLLLASELTGAGMGSGLITAGGINITAAGTLPMLDFSIKMANTSATNLATYVSPIFTTVYSAASVMPVSGINTLTFTTPFQWDGVSNIVIEICHGNSASTATMSRTCTMEATSFISSIHTHKTTSTAGSVQCTDNTTNVTTYSTRPQMYFTFLPSCASPRVPVVATVTSSPAITASSNFTTPCAGNPVQLSVTSSNANYTYEWTSTPSGFTGTGAGPLAATPSVATTYQVLATDNSGGAFAGCGALASVVVTPTANPLSLEVTSSPISVCPGVNVQLDAIATVASAISNYNFASSTSSYAPISGGTVLASAAWDDAGPGLNVPLGFPFSFNGVNYTTCNINLNGYISFGTTTTTTNFTPISTLVANEVGIIAPFARDLQGTSTGEVRYISSGGEFIVQWTNARRYNGTNSNTEVFSFQLKLIQSGNQIKFIYGNFSNAESATTTNLPQVGLRGATSTDFRNLEILSTGNWSTPTLGTSNTQTGYYNQAAPATKPSSGLTYTFSPPVVGGLSYDWTANSTYLSATNIANPVAQAMAASQTYSVTVTDAVTGCTKTETEIVNVNPIPQASASSNSPVCAGQSVSFFGNNTAPGQTNNNTYLWYGPNGFNDVVQNPTLNGSTSAANGTYYVTVTNEFGCYDIDSVEVTIAPLPALNIASQTNLACNGGSDGAFTIEVTNGSGFYLYDENGNINFDGSFSGYAAGTYNIQVTDNNSCASTISVTLTEPDPTTTADAGTDQSACANTTVTMSANTPSVGTGSWSLESGSGTFTDPNDPATTVTGIGTGINVYRWTIDNAICINSNFDDVTVTGGDLPTGTLSGTQEICIGGSANLSISFTGTGPWIYSVNGSSPVSTSNNPETVSVTPTTTTVYAITTLSDANCTGTGSGSATVTVTSAPPASSTTITSLPFDACVGSTVVVSSNVVPGATSYTWSAPAGTLINGLPSPQTVLTNSVNITLGPLPANGSSWLICAFASNACGSTNTNCKYIRGSLSQPSAIVGSTVACPSTGPSTYSTTAVGGASSYLWTITGDASVTGSGTTGSVTFGPTFTTGSLCVRALLPCGYQGPTRCMTIANGTPVLGVMSGTFSVCPGTNGVSYSVPPSAGATTYNWTVPAGATIASGAGTNSITVNFGPAYTNGNVCVTAQSICGVTSLPRCKTVASNKPGTPGNFTSGATTGVCGQTITYSVNSVLGATGYTWTAPAGATIASSNGTNTIDIAFSPSYTTGSVCVTADNACGSSAPRCVLVKATPSNPGVISGASTVCAFDAGISYSIAPVFGANGYVWTVPSGASIVSGQGTTSIIVDWGTSGGVIGVTATGTCGNSGTRTLVVTMNCKLSSTTIPGSTLNAYPNPVSTQLNIELNATTSGSYAVELLDMSGRIIKSEVMNAVIGLNRNSMDVSTLAKGMYMLNVKNEEGFSQQLRIAVE